MIKDLSSVFKSIKKSFTIRKKVDIADLGLTIELEPLTTMEEVRILEACKDFEGGAYIEALKRHSLAHSIKQVNDIDFSDQDLEYEEDGKPVRKSKYLFMLHQIEEWPSALRDLLFEAFNNMQLELESKINEKAKFDRFTVQAKPEEETEESSPIPGFRKIEEPIEEEPENPSPQA